MTYQTRLLSYLYSNNSLISLESAATYYQVCLFFHRCDKQDWATVWYVLGFSPSTGSEQTVCSLVEEVGSAVGVGLSVLDHIGPDLK